MDLLLISVFKTKRKILTLFIDEIIASFTRTYWNSFQEKYKKIFSHKMLFLKFIYLFIFAKMIKLFLQNKLWTNVCNKITCNCIK